MACDAWRTVPIAMVAIASLASLWWLHSFIFEYFFSLVGFFETRSLQACGMYVLIYIVVGMVGLPISPLESFSGFCFGVVLGICLDILGRLTGAIASFLIARNLSRSTGDCGLLANIRGDVVLRGVGKAVESQGLRFLILFNMAYVPVAVKNYGLGFVPEVPLLKFVLAIFIVEVPSAALWVSIGNAAGDEIRSAGLKANGTLASAVVADGVKQTNWRLKAAFLLMGISSIVLVMHIIHRHVSQELAKLKEGEGVESDVQPLNAPNAQPDYTTIKNVVENESRRIPSDKAQ